VVEGAKVLEVALAAGAPVEGVYRAPAADGARDLERVVASASERGVRVHRLRPGVMERISDTVTPQPLCAVVGFVDVDLAAVLGGDLLVVCADLRDPGNLGAVLRSAAAAGAAGVVCAGETVDPYNAKVVRASAGAIFDVPVVIAADLRPALDEIAAAGLKRLATVAHGGIDYADIDLRRPVAFVFGNEAAGLPEEVAGSVDATVTIPMSGRAESLNVAAAAAVLCFEAVRQRRVASTVSGTRR
jgi:TrmH family RNA methyltransferase